MVDTAKIIAQPRVTFDIDDRVYRPSGRNWDTKHSCYKNYEVEIYVIRSIYIFCNSKKEWKIKYRGQQVINGKTTDISHSFTEEDIGKDVFLYYEEADFMCRTMEEN